MFNLKFYLFFALLILHHLFQSMMPPMYTGGYYVQDPHRPIYGQYLSYI